MKTFALRSALAVFLALFAISAATAKPTAILNTRCVETAPKRYSLCLTLPSGGYELSIARVTLKNGVLNIAVNYAAPEMGSQALTTQSLRFTFDQTLRPTRYVVKANGKRVGRAKPIELRGGVIIN